MQQSYKSVGSGLGVSDAHSLWLGGVTALSNERGGQAVLPVRCERLPDTASLAGRVLHGARV